MSVKSLFQWITDISSHVLSVNKLFAQFTDTIMSVKSLFQWITDILIHALWQIKLLLNLPTECCRLPFFNGLQQPLILIISSTLLQALQQIDLSSHQL